MKRIMMNHNLNLCQPTNMLTVGSFAYVIGVNDRPADSVITGKDRVSGIYSQPTP